MFFHLIVIFYHVRFFTQKNVKILIRVENGVKGHVFSSVVHLFYQLFISYYLSVICDDTNRSDSDADPGRCDVDVDPEDSPADDDQNGSWDDDLI